MIIDTTYDAKKLFSACIAAYVIIGICLIIHIGTRGGDFFEPITFISILYMMLFTGSAMFISYLEKVPLVTAFFETGSAIGTVGLSLGLTPTLGLASRLVLICLMFFGRVGGLTLIFATVSGKRTEYKYPQEKINVG